MTKMRCVIFNSVKWVVFTLFLQVRQHRCQSTADFCFRRLEHLGNLKLEWMVDSAKEIITFDIVIEAKQRFGIGFSATENLSMSDFVFCATHENGSRYLLDATIHVDGESVSFRGDVQQDYHLINTVRYGKYDIVQFSRKWNTSDVNDFPFNLNLAHVVWLNAASLETSTVKDFEIFKIYLLDPSSPQNDASLKTWKTFRYMKIPTRTTSYWCTVHKPELTLKQKHHVVGFKTQFSNDAAKRHTHHIVLYKCNPTSPSFNAKATFDHLANGDGDECYYTKQQKIPVNYCRALMYVWAYGGKDFYLPSNAGFPIGESEDEYYLLETHYDNPESLSNLEFGVGLELFYTDTLRSHDAGLFMTGYDISPSLILPPKSEDVMISGHCASYCTRKFIPNSGINIFSALLHSHMSGRKMRLYHTNENKSMSRVIYDDNYKFDFQQTRLLHNERKLSRGDNLIMQCYYNTKWKNGTTFGGFSTRDEMCLAFIWYYPKIPNFNACVSGLSLESTLKNFGIENVMLDSSKDVWEWVVTKPINFANRTLQDVMDNEISWDDNNQSNLYQMAHQENSC
ncbi:unnamed protein product [Orchesella dallaii]|uniref:DOMON domain-containing protein n=1 Tax=Orchesella dallaii TaxID=48710 RepID=A0ABP1S2P8_9HEXA